MSVALAFDNRKSENRYKKPGEESSAGFAVFVLCGHRISNMPHSSMDAP